MCEVTLPDELNTFYACFDLSKESAVKSTPPPEDRPLSVSTADVRRTLMRVNISKAPGPDSIPGHVLRTCANQLVDVITDIFNISLSQQSVSTCIKTATIVPVPKKSVVSSLNDYCPVALINGSVKKVDSFKYLGVHITEGLTWTHHTDCSEEGKAETVSPQTLEEIPDNGLFSLLQSRRRYRIHQASTLEELLPSGH